MLRATAATAMVLALALHALRCAADTQEVAEVAERTILQPLDHFATNPSKYIIPQTYMVLGQYYRPGGPVLLYSVGERAIQASDLNSSWITELAKQTHGMAILLELRFYGDSIPQADTFAIVGQGNLRFLTVEQMMADIRRFVRTTDIRDFTTQKLRNKDLAELSWVFVGGSFAGSLMAWTKHRYPNLNAFVLASSAPMRLTDEYWQFDSVIAQRLPCAKLLSQAIRRIDQILDSADMQRITELKRKFGLESIESSEAFAEALTIQLPSLMQAPFTRSVGEQISEFCYRLEQPLPLHLSASSNDTGTLDNLALITREYSQHHRIIHTGASCPEGDDLGWLWQQCTELGLWQTAPPDQGNLQWFEKRLRSRRLTAAHFQAQCQVCFADEARMENGNLAANRKEQFLMFAEEALFAYTTNVGNVSGSSLFTAGDLDPWQHLFISGSGDIDIGGNNGESKLVSLANKLVIKGASHAEDLRGFSEEDSAYEQSQISRTHLYIGKTIERWIQMRDTGFS
ncbi:hypothetical protein GGF37_002177 [Kickxella alabastrina]|nr:hypothetical protein GGF37_002177 [Kickxella alabastrina]